MKVTCSICGLHVEGRERGRGEYYPGQHPNSYGVRCVGERYPARDNGSNGTGYSRQPKKQEIRR